MNKSVSLLLLFLIPVVVSGQNYYSKIEKAFDSKDTITQRIVLEQWYQSGKLSAEYYTSAFNYYVNKSRDYMLSLDSKQTSDKALVMIDSNKNPVAFISESVEYNETALKQAFSIIDEGIKKYPERLDMRFGKAYMYGETAEYDKFTAEVVAALNYSKNIKHKWLWTNDKPLDKPEAFLKENAHSYFRQLYDVSDSQAANMEKIALAGLELFPNHVEFLSDLAVSYIILNELPKALIPLQKAEKISPKDFIILNNIAEVYYRLKDNANAIKYYKLVLKYGDEDAKEVARGRISELS